MDRYDRLEDKIDKVKDDVTEVKVDVAEMKTTLKNTNELIAEHISGDNKVINQLVPILGDLGSMVEDHKYNKLKKKKFTEKLKTVSLKLSIVGAVVGIGAGIAKILELF